MVNTFVRECIRGEIFQPTKNECYKCGKSYYSIDTKDQECKSCPLNAQCEGGDRIIVNEGFWRKNINSINIYKCNPISNPCISDYKPRCIKG